METQILATAISNENLFSDVYDDYFDLDLRVIGICSVNREEWLITDLAANLLGFTTVALYETLGKQMLSLILEQTELTTLFGSAQSLTNILKILLVIESKSQLKSSHEIDGSSQEPVYNRFLKQIVCFDIDPSPQLIQTAQEMGIKVLSYRQLIQDYGSNFNLTQIIDHQGLQNNRGNIFTISYTSGTEKNSKGVMISNENFLSAITNILNVAADFPFTKDDIYISYLPLAHVFDRLGCYASLSVGACVGFFGGNLLKIIDDLQILKPTIFPSVPRLLNKVYDRIQQGLSQQSFVKRMIFQRGLSSKQFYLQQSGAVNHEMYDRMLFNKIKDRLGGRVRIMITASAPIADNVLAFLKCAFCCPIIEAYGQTESCGSSFSTKIFDNQTGHVGGPALGIEYKLQDIEELGYTSNSQPYPQGEVLLRGPSVFVGYFKNPELTNEILDQDGWLKTGDVGMILPGNALKIIDRARNIFKLSQGEYIVTEKLERAYEQSSYVAQIFIYGDSYKSHIVSVVVPELTTLKQWQEVNQIGNKNDSLIELVQYNEVRELIKNDLQRIAIENGFNGLEQIRNNFRLVDKEFEIGVVLTPTMKLRRQQAKEVYQYLIDEMYIQTGAIETV
ncbi:amp-binding enzyme family protein [Stylonychia lemnae]|uniref:Amp-binding enzyme family protein n=1 Tax=Stylonychia lemnae TaxID=5949 RepID=A0A078AZV8_STYLE|nr:amp-binding enzyme family protein [Stylonychia lemnae]|eukprot:CDW86328.1 amp-binding enzyme family protein [Stylonychia lemnae]